MFWMYVLQKRQGHDSGFHFLIAILKLSNDSLFFILAHAFSYYHHFFFWRKFFHVWEHILRTKFLRALNVNRLIVQAITNNIIISLFIVDTIKISSLYLYLYLYLYIYIYICNIYIYIHIYIYYIYMCFSGN